MVYNFAAQWLKGANSNAPDALSKHPVCNPQPADNLLKETFITTPKMSFTEFQAIRDTQPGVSESLHLQELCTHAQQDEEFQLLCTFKLNGFTKQCKQLSESCRRYWNVQQQLTIDDGLIVYGYRLLISKKMHHQVLTNLHEAYQGAL